MDINIPLNNDTTPSDTGSYPARPTTSELESQMKDLVGYLWDNFLSIYNSNNIMLVGVGDSYLGIKQLLTTRNCRTRIAGVLAFVTGTLRPVKNDTDLSLSGWYKANSKIYVAGNHACWTDPENVKKVSKRRFGTVVPSVENGLVTMLKVHENDAKEWILEKLDDQAKEQAKEDAKEDTKEDEVMTEWIAADA